MDELTSEIWLSATSKRHSFVGQYSFACGTSRWARFLYLGKGKAHRICSQSSMGFG